MEASIVCEGWEHSHAHGGRSVMINRYQIFEFHCSRTGLVNKANMMCNKKAKTLKKKLKTVKV